MPISKTLRYISDDIYINADGIRTDKNGTPLDFGTSSGNTVTSLKNVKDYGAIGDDTTDDSIAIQDTIVAAMLDGSGVFFPKGTYKITTELAFNAINGLSFIGEGPSNTIVHQVTNTANAFHCTDTGGLNFITFRNFQILGTIGSAQTKAGILVNTSAGSSDNWVVERMNIIGFNVGFRASQYSNATFIGCSFFNNHTGLYLDDASNSVSLFSCDFVHIGSGSITDAVGVRYSSGTGLTIIGGDFGGGGQAKALLMDGGNYVSWKGSNCEAYGLTDGYIDHQTTGTYLVLENVAVRNFGGSNVAYSLVQGQNYTTVLNPSFGLIGINGGVVKHIHTINSRFQTTVGVLVDVYLSGVFQEQHLSNLFYTISGSDGAPATAQTKGLFKTKFNGGGADDLLVWVRQLNGGAYALVDLGQYDSDIRSGLWNHDFIVSDSFNHYVSQANNSTQGGNIWKTGASGKWLNFWSFLWAQGDFGIARAATSAVKPNYNTSTFPLYLDSSDRFHFGWSGLLAGGAPTGTAKLNVYGDLKVTGFEVVGGLVTSMNGIATQGMGSPLIVSAFAYTYILPPSSTSSQFSGNLYTTVGAGMYKLDIEGLVVATSTAGTVAVTINSTNTNGATNLAALASTSITALNRVQGTVVFECLTGITLVLTITSTSVGTGAPAFRINTCLTKLQ